MNKEKFKEIAQEEFDKFVPREATPEGWPDTKKELVEIIENIDEAYEVYEMENS